MNRIVLGAFLALVLAGIGLFWMQGRAEVERGAPPPKLARAVGKPDLTVLPTANVAGMRGPTPAEAAEPTREQERFFRYDRNRDGKISRNEMLSTRTAAFRKLDKDGNNLLTFEEWAERTVDKFDGADANHDGILTQAEFATTAPPPKKAKPACACTAPRKPADPDDDE